MNSELRKLLAEIDPSLTEGDGAWQRVAVIRNREHVPSRASALSGARLGFKLLIADRRGEPRWIGRCASPLERAGGCSGDRLAVLSRDRVAGMHVPETRVARSANLLLVATAYVGSRSLRTLSDRLTPTEWQPRMLDVIEVAHVVMSRAAALNPPLLDALVPAEQEQRLERDLTLIEASIDERALVAALRPFLARHAELPFAVQHGDLWAENVIWHAGRWWLIDFDECGEFHNPLHDVFHLLSATPRKVNAGSWFGLVPGEEPDQWARARYAVLRAQVDRLGTDDALVGVAFLVYLVRLVGLRLRPPIQGLFTSRLVAALTRASAFLSGGGSLERLIPLR